MEATLRFGPRCTANDTTDTSRSETNKRREQRKANSERQWQPCQYCGFAVIQRRLCRCNQAQYCDSLCYRRDKPAHRLVCRWGLDTIDAVQWTPCTYCGLGLAKIDVWKCPCRLVRYCDALCQRRDWPAHKLQCHWHRHRCATRLLIAAKIPKTIVADLLRTADVTQRGPPLSRE